MNNTRKVALNTAAQFVGKIVGIMISLTTIGILFRFLGVEGSGRYTTVFAFVSFASLFADLGLGWTLLREMSVEKNKSKVFKNIFTIRLLLGIFVYLAAAAAIWLFKYPIDVKMSVGVLAIAWFFQSLTSNVVQVYLNVYRMDIAVAAEVAGKAIILLIVYLLSIHNGNLMWVMFAYVVGCILNFIIVWLMAGRFVTTGLAFDFAYWRFAFRQALPIGIVLVFGFVYYKVDSIMLSLIKGMTDVGIYGAPYKLLEVLQLFPALFLGSSFSLITMYATTKDDRLQGAFQKQFDFISLIAMPIVIGTFILATPIMAFITGRGGNFINASTITLLGHSMTSVTCLKILIFSVGVNFFTNLYNFMIVSLGKQKQMIWPTIGFALFNILANLYMIPHYSYIGAASTTLATEMLVLLINYIITKRNAILPIRFGIFFKSLLAAIAMGLAVFLIYNVSSNLFLSVASAIVIYGLLAILLDIIPIQMITGFIRRKS